MWHFNVIISVLDQDQYKRTNEGRLEKRPHTYLSAYATHTFQHTTHTHTSQWCSETLCLLLGIITLDAFIIKARPGVSEWGSERKKERKSYLCSEKKNNLCYILHKCFSHIQYPLDLVHGTYRVHGNLVLFMFCVWVHVHMTVSRECVCDRTEANCV